MRTISIAIAMEDDDYAEALAAALARNVRGLTITIIDRSAFEAQAAIDDQERYDALLTDMELTDTAATCKVIYLSEQAAPGMICKYGNIRDITDAVLAAAAHASGRGCDSADALRFDNEVDVYTFVSDAGGTGCSKRALGFAEAQSLELRKRTLYIDAAPLPSRNMTAEMGMVGTADPNAENTENSEINRNIRKLLYHISEGKDMSQLLGTYIIESEKGVYSFRPYKGLSPITSLSVELFESFLGCIEKSGMFDSIVIDAGNHLNNWVLAAAAMSKKVFVIYGSEYRSSRKANNITEGGSNIGRSIGGSNAVNIMSSSKRKSNASSTESGSSKRKSNASKSNAGGSKSSKRSGIGEEVRERPLIEQIFLDASELCIVDQAELESVDQSEPFA